MHLPPLTLLHSAALLLSTTLLASATSSPPTLHTSTIYHQPLTATAPTPLATLSFHPEHPHLSTISSLKPPKYTKRDDDLTRIAVAFPGTTSAEKTRYRSTLADLKSLREGRGRFRITVSEEGELLGVAWHPAVSVPAKEKGDGVTKEGGSGEFDMLVMREGPRAMVDRTLPVGNGKKKVEGKTADGAGGEGEEEVEKTFLQK